jgi:hypothetical protein
MGEESFEQLPSEWWHFEYGTPNWARWKGEAALFGVIDGTGVEPRSGFVS